MKLVALLSGGLDSTCLVSRLLFDGHTVKALTFDYNQRHKREVRQAIEVAEFFRIDHTVHTVPPVMRGSSQTGDIPVPHGHYAQENMQATVVPNRNMVLLSLALAHAISHGFDGVAYAAHAGDHAIYPDCRPQFVEVMAEAFAVADYTPRALITPYLYKTKMDIVTDGFATHAPIHLTHTCYEGGPIACGRCGTCVERLEAFALAGREDPIPYADREFWKTAAGGHNA